MKNGSVRFKDIEVYFKQYGKSSAPAVFLIHGYLESSEIWDDFSGRIADEYRVVVPDLPGHGRSGVYGQVHSMEDLAGAIAVIADHLDIPRFHLTGHSMGGYATMAFREKYPERLISYTLFHSTCFSDNDQKKADRHREIELVEQGKKDLIVNTTITKAFARDNQEKLKSEIERAKRIASESPDAGIVALLNGMIERTDRCRLLTEDKVPLLLIAGMKDNYIPLLKMEEMQAMGQNIKLVALENSGHQGFIEEPGKAASVLKNFMSHFH